MRKRIFWGATAVALVTLVVGVTLASLVNRSFNQQARTELLRQSQATITLLASQLEDTTRTELGVQARQTLEVAKVIGGHDFMELGVGAGDGIRVITADTGLIRSLPDDVVDGSVVTVEIDGAMVTTIVRRVPTQRDVSLVLAIGRNADRFPASVVLQPLGVALGVGGLLVVLLAGLLARSLGRRLESLSETAVALAGGDRQARATVTGRDEISAVAESFNSMADQLAGSEERERQFLMSIGHDLRTPLTTIKGYSEAIEAGRVNEDDLPRVAEVLRRQADRLGRLVEDLMVLARLEAHEFTLRPEDVDVSAHLVGLAESFRSRFDAAHVHLVSEVDPMDTVHIDPDRVAQIVGNLMDNALRFTPEGGRVTLIGRREAADVLIAVSDTGPGIDPEDVPRLFDRLYVAQKYRPVRPEGSGLGL
ncbi:MAG: HAMP domain-containing histidine kinase, partial [Acidimicrobiia bacterium]|nr:HAMP domain-containing histidine kinase [Acidimicrobiia bacterium]